MPSKPRSKQNNEREMQFYETLPMTASKDAFEFPKDEIDAQVLAEQQEASNARATAIVTIAVSIVVAIVMTILFIKGINTIRSIAPQTAPSITTQP